MAAKNKAQLAADLAASLADNTSGAITPAVLRSRLGDFVDSLAITPQTYTVATLPTGAQAAAERIAYCSDCITLNGPGSVVFWDAIEGIWRTMERAQASTDHLTFWRSCLAVGLVARGGKGISQSIMNGQGINALSMGAGLTAAMGAGLHMLHTSTSATGGSETRTEGIPARASLASAYGRAKIYVENLSTAVEEFSVRVEFGGTGSAFGGDSYMLVCDRGNTTGSGNAHKMVGLARSASVNTVAGSSSLDIATGPSTATECEILILPDRVRFYVNGMQIGSDITTGMPSGGTFHFHTVILKSAGTTQRTLIQQGLFYGYILP
jgi:hypothetical protein